MTTKRILMWAATGALATVSAVAISATTWIGASAADDATGDYIRLHIGSDSTPAFTYPGESPQVIKPAKNNCVIDLTPQTLINLTAGPGSQAKPGIANFGIGVKPTNSSGNGNPCAQTDPTETLTLKPGSSSLVAGRSFDKVRLDLEMTGNAIVKLTVGNGTNGPSQVFKLQTGTRISGPEQTELDSDLTPNDITTDSNDPTDACAAASSSNPNSGGADNCLWTVDPNITFTDITLTTDPGGTVALEASADFANDAGHDSLFFFAPGPFADDDEATVNQNHAGISPKISVPIDVLNGDVPSSGGSLVIKPGSIIGTQPNAAVITGNGTTITYTPPDDFVGDYTFTYQALEGTLASNVATVTVHVVRTLCSDVPVSEGDINSVHATFTLLTDGVCKPYEFTVDDQTGVEGGISSVLFQPVGVQQVNYRGTITFIRSETSIVNAGTIELLLQYDPELDNSFRPVPVCDNPVFDAGVVQSADIPNPTVESWCIASVETHGQGADDLVTTWQVWGLDDPNFK
jgi:hypothetical protein